MSPDMSNGIISQPAPDKNYQAQAGSGSKSWPLTALHSTIFDHGNIDGMTDWESEMSTISLNSQQ